MPFCLLLRCSKTELGEIKREAKRERRSINSHVLAILDRALVFEEHLARLQGANRVKPGRVYFRPPGPRTVLFLRCSQDEAARIRAAAYRRGIPINEFVLSSVFRAYESRLRAELALTKG